MRILKTIKNNYSKNIVLIISIALAGLTSTATMAEINNNPSDDTALQMQAAPLNQAANNTLQAVQSLSSVDVTAAAKEPSAPDAKSTMISAFPIVTTLMSPSSDTPGENDTVTMAAIKQPIFLIGNDNYSLKWLQQHLTQLQTLHAIGFLIQAQNADETNQIAALAANLTLIPLSGDSFAKQWDIAHYPVLLMPEAIH